MHDIAVRVFLRDSIEMLGDTSEMWCAQLEVSLVKMERPEAEWNEITS